MTAPAELQGVAPPLHISESWQRCRGMGLDSAGNPVPNAVSRHDLRHLMERDLLLTSVTAEELRTLGLAMADTGHVVILIDDRGRIVSTVGEAATRGPVLRHARSGVDCGEARFGTNAAGTALVEQKPVLVRRSEHFFQDLRHMDCLAAPIFRPGGELIGVIDVSCETRPLLPGVTELLHSSITRIERLLLRELRSPYILRLHPHPGSIGTPHEGLIALGEGGEILGLNTLGARLLGSSQREAVGRPLPDLLGADLRRLGRRSDEILGLRTPDGLGLFATLAEAADLEQRHRHTPLRPPPPCAEQQVSSPPELLTKREQRILHELDSGLSNAQIAAALFISEGTLKWHLHNIYDKLGVRSRAGALARARKQGLLGN